MPVADLWRKHGISRSTFYLWLQKDGGAGISERQQRTALAQEHARRQPMYADLARQNAAIQDVLNRKR